MKFPKVNRRGLLIDVVPATLVETVLELDVPIDGQRRLDVFAPLVPSGDDIVQLVRSSRAPRVLGSVMHMADVRVGVLVVVGPATAVAMVCDLSTPIVVRWLEGVRQHGRMSLALQSSLGLGHLPLHVEGGLAAFCAASPAARPASVDELHSAFTHLTQQFEQKDWLRQAGIDPNVHRSLRVALVTTLAESVSSESCSTQA